MRVTAEIRWFWKDSVPEAFRAWFDGGPYPPGGGLLRVDTYLFNPGQTELSIKKRGENPWLEIKGLVSTLKQPLRAHPFSGRIQLWSKWSTASLNLDNLPTVMIRKTRSLRRFEIQDDAVREIALNKNELPVDPAETYPVSGCNVELTRVGVGTETSIWWTFGCEAFGELESVEQSLRRTIDHLSASGAPALQADSELSYPSWISGLGTPSGSQR
jgi:hypothetical protein